MENLEQNYDQATFYFSSHWNLAWVVQAAQRNPIPVVTHFQILEDLIFFRNFANCAVSSCWQKQLEQVLQ